LSGWLKAEAAEFCFAAIADVRDYSASMRFWSNIAID
jgi:hypothetical protein